MRLRAKKKIFLLHFKCFCFVGDVQKNNKLGMYMHARTLLILLIASFLTGCAIGQKTNYTTGHVAFNKFEFNDDGGCKITVVDKRPYVVSGRKPPTFTGIARGGYGNPFNVNTKSGEPMAEDLTRLFAASYQAIIGSTCITGGQGAARKEITYTLNEWKTDVMRRGRFIYDVDTSVMISGDEVSNEKVSGTIAIDRKNPLANAIIQAANEIHEMPETSRALKL